MLLSGELLQSFATKRDSKQMLSDTSHAINIHIQYIDITISVTKSKLWPGKGEQNEYKRKDAIQNSNM